jgi:hypothetical protein
MAYLVMVLARRMQQIKSGSQIKWHLDCVYNHNTMVSQTAPSDRPNVALSR